MTAARTARLVAAGVATIAAALLAAGCGGDESAADAAPAGETTTVTQPTGPLSVQEALDAGSGEVTVHGWLVTVGNGLKICTTRSDTEPAQCGEPSLTIDGFAGTISAVEEAEVPGTLEGSTLVFDPESLLDLGNAG